MLSPEVRDKLRAVLVPPNSSRIYLESWIADCAKTLQPENLVLDAGAGDARYSYLFSHTRYESADFGKIDKPYAEQTYTCDLQDIPVEDARFDAILCSQVLEHLPYPAKVLDEFSRVLKPGGTLWVSTPLFYEEHEQPYDFFRYTQFGLKHLLSDAGFELTTIDWMEGYFGTLSYQCLVAAKELPLSYLPVRIALTLAAHWFSRADQRRKLTTKGMCKNYMLTATKTP
jgi:SAM-dependent methyltransferase